MKRIDGRGLALWFHTPISMTRKCDGGRVWGQWLPRRSDSLRSTRGGPEPLRQSRSGSRDQIRTGIPFEVYDLSYSLLAHRSQLPLTLANESGNRVNVCLCSGSFDSWSGLTRH